MTAVVEKKTIKSVEVLSKEIATGFQFWLKHHPRASLAERVAQFDKIADRFLDDPT